MSTLEDVYVRYLSYCNDRRLDELGEFVHDEIRFNGQVTSLADYASAIASNLAAVPDFHWTLEDIVANDDTVAIRLTDTGTPQADWLGFTPSGRSMTTQEFAIYRFRNGKIAEMWFLLDVPAVESQLTQDRPSR